jgi:hypothetical protein
MSDDTYYKHLMLITDLINRLAHTQMQRMWDQGYGGSIHNFGTQCQNGLLPDHNFENEVINIEFVW